LLSQYNNYLLSKFISGPTQRQQPEVEEGTTNDKPQALDINMPL
jgi:hypothetical protein